VNAELLADLLPQDVVGMLAARCGGAVSFADCRVIGPLGVSQLSRLFRCSVPGHGPLALKFCVASDGKPDVDQARLQFAALKRLERLAAEHGSQARVVRALDLIEEHACLVMEWIEGRSVAAELASPLSSDADITRWARESGRWLKDFHAMRRLADRPTNCAAMLAQLADEALAAPQLRRNRSFVHGDEVLRRLAPRIAEMPVPVAQHHGDFKAENLMITGGELIGLDIAADWEDAVTLDLAKFIRDITFRSWRPTGWMLGRRFDAIVGGLLDGYGWRDPASPPLLWARLHGLLRFWAGMEVAPLDPIRESYGRYRFEQQATELAAALRAGLE